MAKITKRTVDAAKPESSDYFVWDDDLPGFGLRVWPSGKKVYLLQYRARGEGRTRRYKIGVHGPTTPDKARTEALKQLGDVRDGGNPAERKKLDRDALTVAQLCDRYFADAETGKVRTRQGVAKKASTLATDRGRIERHIKPLLGRKVAKEVTRHDIEDFLVQVETGATADDQRTKKKRGRAIVTGGAGTARRTVGFLGAVFTYGVRLGVRPDNPVSGVKRSADRRMQRYLAPDEYRALGKALRAARKAGENPVAIHAVRALAFTGCRRGEILGLRRTEIDGRHQCLRLQDTKTGKSVRPLGAMALRALRAAPTVVGNSFVFPGERKGEPFMGFAKAFQRIRKLANLQDVTPHTLRHSFATVAGELGYSELTIGALLGHKAASVTSRYTHTVDRVLLAAADQVAAEIKSRMRGPVRQVAKIIRLRRSKRDAPPKRQPRRAGL